MVQFDPDRNLLQLLAGRLGDHPFDLIQLEPKQAKRFPAQLLLVLQECFMHIDGPTLDGLFRIHRCRIELRLACLLGK